jgi:dTDP-glucose pyrophosphorylase
MRNKHPDLFVNKEDSILFVLKKMDHSSRKLLIVMDGLIFTSMVSIGDIQRAIIKGVDLTGSIERILRKDVSFATSFDDLSAIKERMIVRRNELMPIVTPTGQLQDIIFWEDIFGKAIRYKSNPDLNIPVIIMAGGEGTRLKPLTNILPKPLIPINDKTIIEDIMDRFVDSGCHDFFISVNYKADFIRYYLNSLDSHIYNIKYFQEDIPLGTAGSLYLLKDKIDKTFFVSNCDIIIDQDYAEILSYHNDNKNEITVVAAIKQISIPYGTLTTGDDGVLMKMEEKPDLILRINTGFYILEPHLLEKIPENKFQHITTLIGSLLMENRRVGVFPVSEGSWKDIGNWAEYNKVITSCQH